jgi:hypothetical protein
VILRIRDFEHYWIVNKVRGRTWGLAHSPFLALVMIIETGYPEDT